MSKAHKSTFTFDEFIAEAHQSVDAFATEWKKQHANTPDLYPVEFDQDFKGTLWEMLMDHEG